VKRSFQIMRLCDDDFFATVFEKFDRTLNLGPHAADREMPFFEVLSALGNVHLIYFNLVRRTGVP